jgi:hypothetical protein
MHRYFLHLRDGGNIVADLDGSLMASLEAAVVEATANARWIMADQLRANQGVTLNRQSEIADEVRKILSIIQFQDALGPRADGGAAIR